MQRIPEVAAFDKHEEARGGTWAVAYESQPGGPSPIQPHDREHIVHFALDALDLRRWADDDHPCVPADDEAKPALVTARLLP